MQKIGEIKCEIQAAEPGEYATLFEKYKEDTRSESGSFWSSFIRKKRLTRRNFCAQKR